MLNDENEDEIVKAHIVYIFIYPINDTFAYKKKYNTAPFYREMGLMASLLRLLTKHTNSELMIACL